MHAFTPIRQRSVHMLGYKFEFTRRASALQSRPVPVTRGDGTRRCLHSIATAMLFVILAPSVAFAESDGASTVSSIDPAQLETFVDETVRAAMRQDNIAGVSVAIVNRSGPILIKGYGIAAPGRAVDTDTLFPMQSISKTMVWIALMQLVEQGKIRLDDPVNAHLPADLQIPDEGFRKPILIRDLIGHTSGFEDSALGHLFVQRAESLLPLEAYLARFRVHRAREPGTVQVYSNYGAALGGAIVAHVSGMAWEDYVEQRIIQPLGMGAATFRQPYSQDLAKAHGLPPPMPQVNESHLADGFRRGTAGLEAAAREFTADVPAGALVASATNMAAYMDALLNPQVMERAGVLKAQTLLSMRIPFFNGPAGFGDMRYGFQAFALPGDLDAFGHGGDSVYQVASMTLIPSRGLGIFVAANTASGRGLTVRLRQDLAAKFLGAALAPPVYGAQAYHEAASFAGDYRNFRRAYFRTERGLYDLLIGAISVSAVPNGDLLVRSILDKPRLLVPMGGGVYRDSEGPERIAFRQMNGQIGLYEPYLFTAWERVGYFESPGWAIVIIALTLFAAIVALGGAIRRIVARLSDKGFEIYAARIVAATAVAWLAGFLFFAMFLAKGLTASNLVEIMWWYPSAALICSCWAFAAAAALSLASVPSLAVVARSNDWSIWRRGAHALEVLVFIGCSATFWRLGFIGFSGW
jgi:CubicO group peptidase (beta-lactamase class C family)